MIDLSKQPLHERMREAANENPGPPTREDWLAAADEAEALEEYKDYTGQAARIILLKERIRRLESALREIEKAEEDAIAIRTEYPDRTIPIVDLSNTVIRMAEIARKALNTETTE